MKANTKNIPALRFSEFKDKWDSKPLKDVALINPANKNLPEQFFYIDLESVDNGILVKEQLINKKDAPSRAQRLVSKGDILFQMVRPYQMNNLYFNKNGEYVASTGYAQIRSKISANFLYQYLHYEKFVQRVILRCTGTSYPAINSNDLSTIEISYASLPEQQKIADFLTAVDERIQQITKKKQLLEQYKKGVMQQLFSQQLRFKDENGNNYPDWEEKKLKEVVIIKGRIGYRGYTKTDIVANGLGALVIGGKHIINNKIDLTEPTYLSWEKYHESPDIMLELGDIVFSQRGTLGDAAIIEKEIGDATINPSIVIFKKSKINSKYLYFLLTSTFIQTQVKRVSTSSAVPMLSQKQVGEFILLVPSLPEQQRIADFLSSIDNKIEQVQKQIDRTKAFKKGLLQQMFV